MVTQKRSARVREYMQLSFKCATDLNQGYLCKKCLEEIKLPIRLYTCAPLSQYNSIFASTISQS